MYHTDVDAVPLLGDDEAVSEVGIMDHRRLPLLRPSVSFDRVRNGFDRARRGLVAQEQGGAMLTAAESGEGDEEDGGGEEGEEEEEEEEEDEMV